MLQVVNCIKQEKRVAEKGVSVILGLLVADLGELWVISTIMLGRRDLGKPAAQVPS